MYKRGMKSESLNNNMYKQEQNIVPLCDDPLINVEISNVFTPVTCAYLVNEILQGLLYQKSQIPYPYIWLKSVVNKKRGNTNSEKVDRTVNFNATNHFRVVSGAYDTIEKIMKGIVEEFTEKSDSIKEVIFVFGTTPQSPKEIYTIKISSLAKGHLERNHATLICRHRQNILRNIFLSQHWLDAIDSAMTCTNTYVFLKTVGSSDSASTNSSNIFVPSRPLILSPRTKHIRIHLNYEFSKKTDCCENFFVFEDVSDSDTVKQMQTDSIENEETFMWYQSRDLFKGFKDCYINKVSASELW